MSEYTVPPSFDTTNIKPVPKKEEVRLEGNPLAGDTTALEKQAIELGATKQEIEEAKKASYTEEELDRFWDAILANTYYLEEGTIGKGSREVRFTFKTRGTDEVNEINEKIEEVNARLQMRWDVLHAQYLLAASLYAYNNKLLPMENLVEKGITMKTSFERRLEVVEKLPGFVVSGLLAKLAAFDRKISLMQEAVFSENF